MTYKQAQARWAERVRRLYLPPSDLPVFCALCKVSTSTGLCPVCLRSLEEITSWPRLDDEHRRTVWGRVLMRLNDARQYEQAVRRRVSMRRSARGELPPEPVVADDVLLVADSGAQPLAGDATMPPRATDAMAGATSDTPGPDPHGLEAEHAEGAFAQPPAEEVAPAIGPLPPASDVLAAPSLTDTPPDTSTEISSPPVPAAPPAAPPPRPTRVAALPEPSRLQSEVLATHAGVPVDVAAARARQVRLAMAQVVQASLESARREQAQPATGPEEITLKPLI
ncbi:DUF1289 domain-containing protein [Hylemonella gracilis]|uniref:DUF1289 domain-containing protein n=1 Tax=Hylemonella gracilis ATCC 19624 TaxID=887062 RepID=F3KUS8_9BURK|nr:DUF1289 domain-containing protein [Hylemonella gracilis]EGI76421.1 hypothetical protein HGR_11062 [Hylemonella gracilis ATCC 19624]